MTLDPGLLGEKARLEIQRSRVAERDWMIEHDLAAAGILDARVLGAMRALPREEFVPEGLRVSAYEDRPLPIGRGSTISQPAVVARMTELAGVHEGDRVLEIGTGSGYQAAVLASLGAHVYSLEIIPELAEAAASSLARLGIRNVSLRTSDGYDGWPEKAPFDAIVVTAAPPSVPPPLLAQLAPGGRLVMPVGRQWQELVRIVRTPGGFKTERVWPVRFVPMVGRAQRA